MLGGRSKQNIDYKDFLLYNSKMKDSLEFGNFILNGVTHNIILAFHEKQILPDLSDLSDIQCITFQNVQVI